MKENKSKFTLEQRRKVLQFLAAGATLTLPGWTMAGSIYKPTEDLAVTPQQTEGPFYPQPTIEQQVFNDTDLRRKLDNHALGQGQQCLVEGAIRDRKGKPLKESVVEIWQACASGRYHHKRDSKNTSLLDNNFQFWGRAITGDDGKYQFKTIVPGKYPGRTARHIHYRVDADGFKRCSTQCYFSDYGADNKIDGLYQRLDKKSREQLTVEFDKPAESAKPNSGTPAESSIWKGKFDIVLASA